VTIADDFTPPTVTVTTTIATAAESGPTPGVFTITRTGGTAGLDADLAVNFTVGGTATNGVDYVALGSSVLIPAGQVSATVTVMPIDDGIVEGDETVILTLQPGPYLIGAPASATVTITDNELIVTNTNDSGAGSLRQAILDANAHGGSTDTIVFNIP